MKAFILLCISLYFTELGMQCFFSSFMGQQNLGSNLNLPVVFVHTLDKALALRLCQLSALEDLSRFLIV